MAFERDWWLKLIDRRSSIPPSAAIGLARYGAVAPVQVQLLHVINMLPNTQLNSQTHFGW